LSLNRTGSIGVGWLLFALSIILFQLNQPPTITIEWQTDTEQATAGFFVTRALSEGGSFERIHTQLIPSNGSSTLGAVYQFTDHDVEAGQTYFYLLQEIELDNSIKQYADFIQEHKAVWFSTKWRWLTAVSTLIGIYLMKTSNYEA